MIDLVNRYVTWKPTQEDFLDSLVETFGSRLPGVTPEYVNITVRFYTYDQANPLANVTDRVIVQVHGNGKTKTELCDFDVLQISPGTAMSGTRKYYVGTEDKDGEQMSILVSTIIDGKE
jgi:hypothetical protein